MSADRTRSRLRTVDILAAAAAAVLSVAGALALPALLTLEPEPGIRPVSPADAAWWLVLAALLAQAVALLWARRFPLPILAAVTLVPLAHAIVTPGTTYSLTTIGVSFGVFWAVYGLRTRVLMPTLAGVVVVLTAAQTLNDARIDIAHGLSGVLGAGLQAVAVVGIPLIIGLVAAARRDTREARAAELLAVQRERDAVVQAAVSRERVAMSRELHDNAAHHKSGIALLASAIARQIDVDPDAAKTSAERVRAQSTVVLDDLRRVIGLLRDEANGPRNVETLAAIIELVELRRAVGADVTLTTHAGAHELGTGIGPLAQLVAYRMVQESLANAGIHAPGAPVVVELDDRSPTEFTVTVINERGTASDPGPGSGLGLVGMRERADLVDGRLHHGPTAAGGWEVRLQLTRDTTLDQQAPQHDPPGAST
jgi:signal transduction histidine kinase